MPTIKMPIWIRSEYVTICTHPLFSIGIGGKEVTPEVGGQPPTVTGSAIFRISQGKRKCKPSRIREGFSYRRIISRAVMYSRYRSSSLSRSIIRMRSSFILPLLSGHGPPGWALCFNSLRAYYKTSIHLLLSKFSNLPE